MSLAWKWTNGACRWTSPSFPSSGRGQLTIRDSNAQLARGRATLQTELLFSADQGPRVEGKARFYNAQLKSLFRPSGRLGLFRRGASDRQCRFLGRQLSSADDLNATLDATLGPNAGAPIAGAERVGPVRGARPVGDDVSTRGLRGRLSRGVFRIQKFNLSSRDRPLGYRGNDHHGGPARPGGGRQRRASRL